MNCKLLAAVISFSIATGSLFSANHHLDILFSDNTIRDLHDSFEINTNGEYRLLKNYIKKGFVVFDVGAHVGEWSLKAYNSEPQIHLYSFEPTPNSYHELLQKLKLTSAHVFNLALSSHKGTQNLYTHVDGFSGINSLFHRDTMYYDRNVTDRAIEVHVDTLDEFCARNSISKIDFLKIDTEGSELEILKGAEQLIRDNKIVGIQFEYGGTYVAANCTFREIAELLTKNNYCIFRIRPRGLLHLSQWEPALENYAMRNFFAILQSEVNCSLMTGF